MPPPNILDQTLALLRADRRSIAQLAKDTGLGYHWLRKMRAGQIRNPGFERVNNLYQCLTQNA
jgi:hypothetical protein